MAWTRREKMTPRRLDVLQTIDALTRRHGYPPTLRELGKATGIASTNGVRDHLVRLERDGYIKTTPGLARSIVIDEYRRHEWSDQCPN